MRLAAALIAALALLVTACGGEKADGGGGGTDPAALLAAAIGNADKGESFESDVKLDSDLGGTEMSVSGRMISNADNTLGRGTMTYSEGSEEPFEFEMILLRDEMFLRSEAFAGALPKGKTWMRSQDETLAQQSLTPKQLVDLLRDTPEVEEVGREDVRGNPTIHLRGPFDIKAAAERIGSGPITALVEQQPEMVERIKSTIDVWIGAEDERLERVAMEMSVDGEPGKLTVTGDILEEGVSLDSVKAPPDDEVVDEADVPGMG